MEVLPISVPVKKAKFDVYESFKRSSFRFKDNDILVISSKYVSMGEGAIVSLSKIRTKFFIDASIKVGIVVADSRLMPTRIGTTGVAIAVSGFEPVEDQRGKKDLFGNVLKVTFKAVADSLATIGVAVMGESNEAQPAAVIRGLKVISTERRCPIINLCKAEF